VGVGAYGGIALGWQASGFCAIAWNAAIGNFAIARDFALGNFVRALQSNNDFAHQFIDAAPFFRFVQWMNRYWFWTNFLWVTPLFIQWRLIARSRRLELGNS
jgi:hypothetical protein